MTIISLGGGINFKGEIPSQVKKRLQKAKELFNESKQKSDILLCGKYSLLYPKDKLPPITEAMAMKKHLLKLGVPEEKIHLEEKSQDTISNAYYAKKEYFLPYKKKKATVITSKYHLPRVKYIFKMVFGPDYKISFISTPSSFKEEETKKMEERQKEVLKETKEIMKKMTPGDHEFLRDIFFNIPFYTKEKPAWVIQKITQGK